LAEPATERFLVTGAGGCIGSWVIAQLAREGVSVVGLDLATDARRLREIAGNELADSITIEQADITSKDEFAGVVDAHEITNIVHLAALQIPFCRADPTLGARVNVVGTVNAFEVIRERLSRIGGLVYASSVALFGSQDTELALTDESGVGATPGTLYGVYKQANEGTARVYWEETAIPSIGLRPSTVYGGGRDQGVTSAPTLAIAAAVRGERYAIPFGGESLYNYAPDVAAALVQSSRALKEGASVFNVPGTSVDMVDVVGAIERAVPDAAGMIEFAPEVLLPVPAAYEVGGLAERVGQIHVTPFDEAVRETVEHFRRAS
jgi:UDP-glucuronate 4-epimerase